MPTETKLLATISQATELIRELQQAIEDAQYKSEPCYARVVLEQIDCDGPWRLVIGVCREEPR